MVATLIALSVLAPVFAGAATRKTEAQLIAMLDSKNYQDVLDAMDRLPNWYPGSTNAIQQIRRQLRTTLTLSRVPKNLINRKAARALGNYGATLEWDDVKIFIGFIRSADIDEVMDGLKALRGLKEPPDIERKIADEVVVLLKDKETHIVRDAMRTLATVGNAEVIPAIEPFVKYRRLDVSRDARDAIAAIRKRESK